MICQNCSCEKPFNPKTYNQKYCSKNCANTDHIRHWRKNNMKQCQCGNLILPESTFCRSCVKTNRQNITKSTTLQEVYERLSVKGKHPSWKNSCIRNLARYWHKDLQNKPCQHCGYKIHVEICHIKDISDFSPNTTIGLINNIKNILVLCRNCHWEFDHNILSLQEILNKKH
jgi:hypothetical protein